MAARSLTDLLLEMGAIDPMQLKVAQAHAQQWGVPLEQALVERRFCSLDDVVRACSRQTGYPVINLDAEVLDPARADLLPEKLAAQYRMVPLRLSGRRYEVLELAVEVPPNLQAVDTVLSLAKKQRAVVHLTHHEAIDRGLARLYGGGGGAAVLPPALPAAELKVDVQNEQTFEFGDEPAAPSTPVYLFGWHPAAAKAMSMMLEQAALRTVSLDDEGLETIGKFDVLISTTLGLRAALPPDARLKCRLIICGTPEPGDAEDARALGARLYLRPPHSTEQLKKAVHGVLKPK